MILIAHTEWNDSITGKLVEAAEKFLQEKDVPYEVIKVPGALELPLAIKWAWKKARQSQKEIWGAVACGTVIRGDTYHFEIVADNSCRDLAELALELELPIGNAILAVDNIDQALDRAGGSKGNKGVEASEAVLQMLQLKKKIGL
jgi:6,7-dimethyl-8-ribityllumazine synthase